MGGVLSAQKKGGVPYPASVTTTKHGNSCQLLFRSETVAGGGQGLSRLLFQICFCLGFSGNGQNAGYIAHMDEFLVVNQHEDLVVLAA